jgi:hypothetical protein
VREPPQLDIFIPLQWTNRLHEWAALAQEYDFDLTQPGGARAFASWLRRGGYAPPAHSEEALTLLGR